MKIENFFFSIFDFVRFLKKVPLNCKYEINYGLLMIPNSNRLQAFITFKYKHVRHLTRM